MATDEHEQPATISPDMEPFMHQNFDALSYSRGRVKQGETETNLSNLKRLASTVDQAIDRHVAANGEVLLERLTKSAELESSLASLKSSTGTLVSALRRIRQDVSDPFEAMKSRVMQLENVQAASGLLQRVSWFIQAVKRVRQQLEKPAEVSNEEETGNKVVNTNMPTGARELSKVAQLMQEVERLLDQDHMDRISSIQPDRKWALETGKLLRSNAQVALQKAIMAYPNQTEVHSALQTFYHLRCLPEVTVDICAWAAGMAARDTRNWLGVHQLRDSIESGENVIEPPTISPTNCGLAAPVSQIIQERLTRKETLKVRSKVSPPTNSQQRKVWVSSTWGRVKQLQPALLHWCLRIWNLQRVLCKIQDPTNTGRVFNDIVVSNNEVIEQALSSIEKLGQEIGIEPLEGNNHVYKRVVFGGKHPTTTCVYTLFWNALVVSLYREFAAIANETASPFVNQVLTADYARLRRSLRMILGRLVAHTGNKQGPSVGASKVETDSLLLATQPFLSVYVNRSWNRLRDFLDRMFPEGLTNGVSATPTRALPTKADVKRFADGIVKELVSANDDTNLVVVLCGRIKNAILSFAAKAEELVVMEAAAFRFLLSPGKQNDVVRTTAQQHNVALLDITLQLATLLGNLPLMMRSQSRQVQNPAVSLSSSENETVESSIEQTILAIEPATKSLSNLCDQILGGYLVAATKALDSILSKMHNETFVVPNGNTSVEESEASEYMSHFREAVEVVAKEHLEKLPSHPRIAQARVTFLQRIVVMFIRQLSCIRPIDEFGRGKLARDMAEFELAVGPISPTTSLDSLGVVYKELRAFRRLLFTDIGKVNEVLTLANEIRPSHIWHHLFSGAPDQLRSPHVEAGLSVSEYFNTLDHAELGDQAETNGFALLECGSSWPSESCEASRMYEARAWKYVEDSLEKYSQRVSASSPTKLQSRNLSEVDSEDPLSGLTDCYHLCYALRHEQTK